MKETIQVINKMVADGVIEKYAIGGAIGAAFYIEPTPTYDIDIFIAFKKIPGSAFVLLTPIYDYLRQLGYRVEGEYVVIEKWNVQFLPAEDSLYAEALDHAVSTTIYEETIWVMSAEHLMAIALRTGRSKDFIRLDQFLTSHLYSEERFSQILGRQKMRPQWEKFKQRFLD